MNKAKEEEDDELEVLDIEIKWIEFNLTLFFLYF